MADRPGGTAVAVAERPSRLLPLEQERARETRRRLVRAATELWTTHGFDHVPVRDVCERAGVSKGSFYRHFERKEDLLLELAIGSLDQVTGAVDAATAAGAPTLVALRAALDALAARATAIPQDLLERTIIETFASIRRVGVVRGERQDLRSVFVAIIDHGQRRGELAAGHEADELARSMIMVTEHAMLEWAAVRSTEALDEVLWRHVSVLHGGLAVPPAVRP